MSTICIRRRTNDKLTLWVMIELLTVNLTWVNLLLSLLVIRVSPRSLRRDTEVGDMSHTTLTAKSLAMNTGS